MANPSSPSYVENPRSANLSVEFKEALLGLQMINNAHIRVFIVLLSMPSGAKEVKESSDKYNTENETLPNGSESHAIPKLQQRHLSIGHRRARYVLIN
jgi:hypothetical protein